jgi:hypothetical protein
MSATPDLNRLARACYNGACNIRGLVRSLNESLGEIPPGREKESVDLKIILGQLSFLAGDNLGPSEMALEQFRQENKLA